MRATKTTMRRTKFGYAYHLALVIFAMGCGDDKTGPTVDAGSDVSTNRDAGGCLLTANTTASGTTTEGCPLLVRDTTGCESARRAAGFSGFWLKFSCRVTLSKVTVAGSSYVQLTSDNLPDYPSNYFPTGDVCLSDYVPAGRNPNKLQVRNLTMRVPVALSTAGAVMGPTAVGLAINGVELYSNTAAPGDDIFKEAASFDLCEGHPTGGSIYHYHSEPHSISADDSKFIGVMLDGYPVYGRRDADGSLPALDASGGHTGTTVDSTEPVYHYHVNKQTSTTAGTAGQTAWFLTTGRYAGTPGTCTGC